MCLPTVFHCMYDVICNLKHLYLAPMQIQKNMYHKLEKVSGEPHRRAPIHGDTTTGEAQPSEVPWD